MGARYQGNAGEYIDIKGSPPFLGLGVADLLHRLEHAVVHDEPVQAVPVLESEIGGPFAD